MTKRIVHSIALNEKEQKELEEIKDKLGLGVTAIYREGIKSIKSSSVKLED